LEVSFGLCRAQKPPHFSLRPKLSADLASFTRTDDVIRLRAAAHLIGDDPAATMILSFSRSWAVQGLTIGSIELSGNDVATPLAGLFLSPNHVRHWR
jgi:hypothetical protein